MIEQGSNLVLLLAYFFKACNFLKVVYENYCGNKWLVLLMDYYCYLKGKGKTVFGWQALKGMIFSFGIENRLVTT